MNARSAFALCAKDRAGGGAHMLQIPFQSQRDESFAVRLDPHPTDLERLQINKKRFKNSIWQTNERKVDAASPPK